MAGRCCPNDPGRNIAKPRVSAETSPRHATVATLTRPSSRPLRNSAARAAAVYCAGSVPGGTRTPSCGPKNTMTCRRLAAAALWANLLSRDLTSQFHARMRPVDDPLLYLLADPRRVRSLVSDGLWIRLTDVSSALALRHYACPVDVVIEVADELCPHNAAAGGWLRPPMPLSPASAPPANGPPPRPT